MAVFFSVSCKRAGGSFKYVPQVFFVRRPLVAPLGLQPDTAATAVEIATASKAAHLVF